MMIEKRKAERLAVYCFYDKDGIVDRYVPYFLEELRRNVSEIFIVCNGEVRDAGRAVLERYGQVLPREPEGRDVWAYRAALEYYGWERLARYDEVILVNSSVMGPVYPFRETFEKMDEREVDFWGLTKHFEIPCGPCRYSPHGYIPEHIRAHWIACRRTLVQSQDFKDYWKNIPEIEDYAQSVRKHEFVFTKHFADRGFRWDVSVPMEDLRTYAGNPLLMCPKRLLAEGRCPVFERRSFSHRKADFLAYTTGEQTTELFDYLDLETGYDVDYIWETILRNYHQYDIVKNLNLTCVLSAGRYSRKRLARNLAEYKTALVMHIYFEDLIEDVLHYARSVPEETDVYVTTDTEEKRIKIQRSFSRRKKNKPEVRVIPNRGRDVGSLLAGVKDVVLKYDMVCFAHDKKVVQISAGIVGGAFSYKCFENILSSRAYVANIIDMFASQPRLGMLSPPEPNHGSYFMTTGTEWGQNYDNTKSLAEAFGLKAPMDFSAPPVAPFGTMFWFRPAAMRKLYEKDWAYEDFPPEPNEADGTLLHAIERMYPFVVQDAGYYPAVAMTDRFAAVEYGNLRHYVRGYNQTMAAHELRGLFPDVNGALRHVFQERDALKKELGEVRKELDGAKGANEQLGARLEQALYDRGSIKLALKLRIQYYSMKHLPERMHKAIEKKWLRL